MIISHFVCVKKGGGVCIETKRVALLCKKKKRVVLYPLSNVL